MDQVPFDDAQGFRLPLIISPSDQFMFNVVLVVTFQFLFCFLAQVATKNRFSFSVVLTDFTQNNKKIITRNKGERTPTPTLCWHFTHSLFCTF